MPQWYAATDRRFTVVAHCYDSGSNVALCGKAKQSDYKEVEDMRCVDGVCFDCIYPLPLITFSDLSANQSVAGLWVFRKAGRRTSS